MFCGHQVEEDAQGVAWPKGQLVEGYESWKLYQKEE